MLREVRFRDQPMLEWSKTEVRLWGYCSFLCRGFLFRAGIVWKSPAQNDPGFSGEDATPLNRTEQPGLPGCVMSLWATFLSQIKKFEMFKITCFIVEATKRGDCSLLPKPSVWNLELYLLPNDFPLKNHSAAVVQENSTGWMALRANIFRLMMTLCHRPWSALWCHTQYTHSSPRRK